jgi:cytosine/adenosine deaminase-related metal-dependent hydrolase
VPTNILIDEGKIIEISNNIHKGEIIDVTGAMICPSFLNGHTHIGDSVIKDYSDGKSIDELVKPPDGLKHLALSGCSDDEIISAMKDSMWEMLKTGTTHFIDYREGGIEGIELLKDAASNIPINSIIFGRDPIFHDTEISSFEIKKTIVKLLKNCDGIGLSGFGEISTETCEIIVKECLKRDKISSIHVGEYLELQKKSIKETGKTEIERAINLNFELLIHSTYPTKNDIKLIAKNNKILTICLRSNGTLSLGIPPFLDLKTNGIKTLIGTDNLMFNSPNLMREMEYILKIMRAKYKNYINPKDILKLATVEGSNNSNNSLDNSSNKNFTNLDNNLNKNSMNLNNSSNKNSTNLNNSSNKNFTNLNNNLDNSSNKNSKNLDNNLNKNNSNFYSIVNKSVIEEGCNAQLFITKLISKNPYLNIINRVEIDSIISTINKDKFLYWNK